jgi:hypothetical protein
VGWRGLDTESDVGCQLDQKESEAIYSRKMSHRHAWNRI